MFAFYFYPLLKINLAGNGIGDDAARAIAEALKINLYLWRNQIGDDGALAIAEALEGCNPSLQAKK